MSQDRQGKLAKIKAFLQRGSKDTEQRERSLGQYGVSFDNDRKLEETVIFVNDMLELLNTPIDTENLDDYIEAIKTNLDLLNRAIITVLMKYGRASTYMNMAKGLHGWTRMYSLASSWTARAESLAAQHQKQSETSGLIDIDILIRNHFYISLIRHVFKDGQLLLAKPFREPDVSPRGVTVIQTMIPAKGHGIDLNVEAEKL